MSLLLLKMSKDRFSGLKYQSFDVNIYVLFCLGRVYFLPGVECNSSNTLKA